MTTVGAVRSQIKRMLHSGDYDKQTNQFLEGIRYGVTNADRPELIENYLDLMEGNKK